MRLRKFELAVIALVAVGALCGSASAEKVAIRASKILTMDEKDTVVNNGVVLVDNGKITAVGKSSEVEIPDGYRVIDGGDRWIVPGMIEGHNHIGGNIRDLNENVWLTNPGIRIVGCPTPMGNDTSNQSPSRCKETTTVPLVEVGVSSISSSRSPTGCRPFCE